jgi:hypothetical protein
VIPPGDLSSFVPRSEVESILENAPLDEGFAVDVEWATDATIDEL